VLVRPRVVRPAADVIILKNIFAKKFGEKIGVLTENKAVLKN
jgi:hypothetical protein